MASLGLVFAILVVASLIVAFGIGYWDYQSRTEEGSLDVDDDLQLGGGKLVAEEIDAGELKGRDALTWANLEDRLPDGSPAVTILRREGVTLSELEELYRRGTVSSVSGIGEERAEDIIEAAAPLVSSEVESAAA